MNNHQFKKKLTEKERIEIINLYNSIHEISINQFPGWEEINNPNSNISYYTNHENSKLIAYAIIIEKHLIAQINYGPVAKKIEDINLAIEAIITHYKTTSILKVIIKLGKNASDSIAIYNTFKNKFVFKSIPYNWSTLQLDLNQDLTQIIRGFSTNHKRSIKKAEKMGVKTKVIKEKEELIHLAAIYDKMYTSRKIIASFFNTKAIFNSIFEFFEENKNGFILGVYLNDCLIGGLIIPLQGNTAYYQYGMTDVDHRKTPILHKGFVDSIKISKELGIEIFDFGGYIPYELDEQIININRFKEQFGGLIYTYPKNLHFVISPFKYSCYAFAKYIYLYFRKLKTIFIK